MRETLLRCTVGVLSGVYIVYKPKRVKLRDVNREEDSRNALFDARHSSRLCYESGTDDLRVSKKWIRRKKRAGEEETFEFGFSSFSRRQTPSFPHLSILIPLRLRNELSGESVDCLPGCKSEFGVAQTLLHP